MTALVLPLAFAACTNEEDFSSNPGLQGETLTVAVERGAFGADTKATWVDKTEGAGFEWTKTASDKIGMALINPSDASKVLTNYEMSLIGWSNGSGKGDKSNYSSEAGGVKYTTTYATAQADENAGNGVFQATGLTVMDGNYIVYHPYDPNFAKAGYMAVDFKTKQTAESTIESGGETTSEEAAENMLAAAGDNAFSYSLPTTIEKGGKVASTFATKNLSALLKISLTKFTGKKLKKVILLEDAANFDKNSKGFLKSAYLNAEKIKTQSGAAVLETPTYSSMITLAFTDDTNNTPGLDLSTTGEANIYMVAGPRTATTQYSILLIDDENKASIWKSNVALTAGNKSTIKIESNASHPFETYIVTEGADLKAILETAQSGQDGYDNSTINILGELEVKDLGTVAAKNVTVQAYGDNAETSVTFKVTTTHTAQNGMELTSAAGDNDGLNFKVPVTLDAENGKCIALNGKVTLAEVTNNAGDFKVRGSQVVIGKLTNEGLMAVTSTATLNTTGNVTNNGTVQINLSGANGGIWNIGQGTTLTNNGTINNSATVNNFGTINNSNGTYVQKLKGNFIGQNDIAADKRGNYVIEVANNDQFLYANTTTCTTIRVVGGTIDATTGTGQNVKNILKNLNIAKNVELTGTSTLNVDNTTFKNVYVIGNATAATISGTATADLIQVNAKSSDTATAPKLTIKANSIIKAKAIVNNGTGSIEKGSTNIPADVKTLSSTGNGTWDNYPQVVASL